MSFWDAASLRDCDVSPARRLTLGEGDTPAHASTVDRRIVLKREDANPSGSHKDRAACLQLARCADRGDSAVTISSSGNAGVATSRYAQLHDVEAFVCVHPATDPRKLAAIDGATTTVVVTERAINTAKHLARELRIDNLRPSVHDDAIAGYRTLGDELAALTDIDTIVLFATSGATALAVAARVHELRPGEVQVHFVQGEGNAALADPQSQTTDASARAAAAGRLGVRRSRRARHLHRAIAATGGRGHVATAAQVAQAREALAQEGIAVGDESAANLAIARELADAGRRVVCVISGAPPTPAGARRATIEARDERDALAQLRR